MDTKPFLVVSDIHLGAVPPSTEQAFRGFLDHAAEVASGLLINGDLFDFWFEYRTVVPRKHFRTLARLADLIEQGVPVLFVGGNHDAWGGEFLRDEVGIRMFDGPVELELAGWRALVAHGDGVGSGDLGYRALRSVIRSPLAVHGFRLLHPDWGSRVAAMASSTEHKAEIGDPASQGRARFIEEWAIARLREDSSLQLVLAGHAHVPALREVSPRRYYINTGDWISHFTYLVLPQGNSAPELRTWKPDEKANQGVRS